MIEGRWPTVDTRDDITQKSDISAMVFISAIPSEAELARLRHSAQGVLRASIQRALHDRLRAEPSPRRFDNHCKRLGEMLDQQHFYDDDSVH